MNAIVSIIGFVVLILLIKYLLEKKLIIRFDTLFRKGFAKKNDKFRSFLFLR